MKKLVKNYFLIILLITLELLFYSSTLSSPARPLYIRTKMIQRLIGEGETEGWGSDLGIPFLYKNKLIFLGGDTNKENIWLPNIIGIADATNPSNGFNIRWKKNEKGNLKEFFNIIEPSSTVPSGAISISNIIYVFMMDVISWDYPAISRSILIKSVDDGDTFITVWEGKEDNKFINIAPVISAHPTEKNKKALYLVGSGKYRESPIYLAYTEIDSIEKKSNYRFFAGLENGSPIWKKNEIDALPIVDEVKVGELSIQWNSYLEKWLLSYFDYSNKQSNMYFRTAPNLWGPWSKPIFVFSGVRKYDWYKETLTKKGYQSWGIPYGSYLIPETNTYSNSSKVYFTLSLWVPYSIFLLEADLNVLDIENKRE